MFRSIASRSVTPARSSWKRVSGKWRESTAILILSAQACFSVKQEVGVPLRSNLCNPEFFDFPNQIYESHSRNLVWIESATREPKIGKDVAHCFSGDRIACQLGNLHEMFELVNQATNNPGRMLRDGQVKLRVATGDIIERRHIAPSSKSNRT